ncbi:MAG TPA: hypothetical protein VIA06_09645 [Candidatus Dormibacteraeota bacterium]|jgi:hypothetical protein|nr:hypothetical protein [Candidatus Dormibacteraeota bacterium]
MQPARDLDRSTLTIPPERVARIAGQTFPMLRDATLRCSTCGRPTPGGDPYCSRDCEESAPGSYLG